MAFLQPWSRLSRLSIEHQTKLTDRRLAQHMREELLPFSPWLRKVARELGLSPRQLSAVRDLPGLPSTSRADLLSEPDAFVLVPDPRTLREHWPFGRKLALSLSGGRGGRLLRASYGSLASTPLPRGHGRVWLHSTSRCLAVAAEVGARAYSVLGLERPDERVVLAAPAGYAARECWLQGRFQNTLCVHDTGGPDCADAEATALRLAQLNASALIAEPPFAQAVLESSSKDGLSALRVIALVGYRATVERKGDLRELARERGAREVQVCNVFDPPATRLVFPEAPAEPERSAGFVTFPDIACFEQLDPERDEPVSTGGELCFTTLAQRGTALIRYRLGWVAEDGIAKGPGPAADLILPRIQPQLRRIERAFSAEPPPGP